MPDLIAQLWRRFHSLTLTGVNLSVRSILMQDNETCPAREQSGGGTSGVEKMLRHSQQAPAGKRVIPGTPVFDGDSAQAGYELNAMCFSFNSKANRDAFVADRPHQRANRSRLGMLEDDRAADFRPDIGLKEGAARGDLAERRRGGRLGDQHAHPPSAPARRHTGPPVEIAQCPHDPPSVLRECPNLSRKKFG